MRRKQDLSGKTMLLLGSGASTPFGKLVTKDFKELLYNDYPTDYNNGLIYHLLRHPQFLDIEHVLDCAVKLSNFGNNTAAGEFLSTLGKNLLLTFYYFKDEQRSRGFDSLIEETKNAVDIIQKKVLSIYRWNFDFDEKLVQIYNAVFNFLNNHSDSLLIATTNYDRAIERFCEKSQYHYYDGFEHSYSRYLWNGKFTYPELISGKNVILYKLHGSLGWKRNPIGEIERVSEESDPSYSQSMLIYTQQGGSATGGAATTGGPVCNVAGACTIYQNPRGGDAAGSPP
jgi:hypothetical protein